MCLRELLSQTNTLPSDSGRAADVKRQRASAESGPRGSECSQFAITGELLRLMNEVKASKREKPQIRLLSGDKITWVPGELGQTGHLFKSLF